MKIVCGEYGTLDVDAINEYKPDGKKQYCQVTVAGYDDSLLADSRKGTYLKTSDNGIIFFTDFAFKMLLDFSIKAQLDVTKYLLREISRAESTMTEEAADILNEPDEKSVITEYLHMLSVDHILVRNVSQVIGHNLLVFREYDLMDDWFRGYEHYSKEYRKAYMDVIGFIMDYVYIPKDERTFEGIQKILVRLFNGMDAASFKMFVDGFYELVDKISDAKYAAVQPKAVILPQPSDEAKLDAPVEASPEVREFFEEKKKAIRKVSVTDITGTDATYTAGYCESLYDDELEHADSEGFLEKLIISRVNQKASPIDVLSETVAHEHDKNNPASVLRTNLSNLRENAEEALTNEN